ncbi:hypothetical protein, partial [Chromatium okenii]|uniref:hypothetical protein n=1 Tax=Chromatium okenii TaxID=61644 RepID=UPI0026E9E214
LLIGSVKTVFDERLRVAFRAVHKITPIQVRNDILILSYRNYHYLSFNHEPIDWATYFTMS